MSTKTTAAPDKVKTVKLREITVRGDACEWARVLWEPATGRVFLVTSWGDWSACWRHIGDQTLPQFLAGLSTDYAGQKFLGESLYEFDHDETVKRIRREILTQRRTGWLTKEEAESEWKRAGDYADGWIADFREWFEGSRMDCPYELAARRISGPWAGFWERLWIPKIVPALRAAV